MTAMERLTMLLLATGLLLVVVHQCRHDETHEAQERERVESALPSQAEPTSLEKVTRQGEPAPSPLSSLGDAKVAVGDPPPPPPRRSRLMPGLSDTEGGGASVSDAPFTAARELFWVPSEEILLHVYRCESQAAGLYDEATDTLSVDPQIVHEAWVRDGGLRAALARFCELVEIGSQAWGVGRQDVVDALERDRVAAVAELWRYYSPAAYAAYTEAQR